MATLLCDICGEKIIVRAGGTIVCENCGMEYSKERLKEKLGEVNESAAESSAVTKPVIGTPIHVDNTHLIGNYLELADGAYKGENYKEAEMYCNKAIEIDAMQSKAWLLRGKSIGWQSTLAEPKYKEGASSLAKALSCASNEKKEQIIREVETQLFNLSYAILKLQKEDFVNSPTEDEKDYLLQFAAEHYKCIVRISEQEDVSFDVSKYLAEIASIISLAATNAYLITVIIDYEVDTEAEFFPGRDDFRLFIERVGYCTELLNRAINLAIEADDDISNLNRYYDLITMHEDAINSCSYVHDYDEQGREVMCEDLTLSDSAKKARKEIIAECRKKINNIEASIAQKEKEESRQRFEEYWEKNADRKKKLEEEIIELEAKIGEYLDEINRISGKPEAEKIKESIESLNIKKKNLGLFKTKEKKSIQEKIDNYEYELNIISERMDNERERIESKMKPLDNRIKEIHKELTRER